MHYIVHDAPAGFLWLPAEEFFRTQKWWAERQHRSAKNGWMRRRRAPGTAAAAQQRAHHKAAAAAVGGCQPPPVSRPDRSKSGSRLLSRRRQGGRVARKNHRQQQGSAGASHARNTSRFASKSLLVLASWPMVRRKQQEGQRHTAPSRPPSQLTCRGQATGQSRCAWQWTTRNSAKRRRSLSARSQPTCQRGAR